MNTPSLFAATYNCNDSANSAYGEGAYSTCQTTSVGAPDTGSFFAKLTTGQFDVLLPTVIAVAVALASAISLIRKNKKSRSSTR